MIFVLVLIVHIIVSLILVGVILLQGGRGGLSESLGGAAAQSLFGGGVATVLTRITTACACLFVVTCLSLAYLSTMRGRSVVEQVPLVTPEGLPIAPTSLPQPSTRLPITPQQTSRQLLGTGTAARSPNRRVDSEPTEAGKAPSGPGQAAQPSQPSASHIPTTEHSDASPSQ